MQMTLKSGLCSLFPVYYIHFKQIPNTMNGTVYLLESSMMIKEQIKHFYWILRKLSRLLSFQESKILLLMLKKILQRFCETQSYFCNILLISLPVLTKLNQVLTKLLKDPANVLFSQNLVKGLFYFT
ncbi:hypothetical protein XENOCAPTIV_004109 [Xenoophorus captivus]|uniref:Uncharacterized protein n=1 Tax=Xenoophorus captivus TaxID=1517983 RepID=A0ABV0QU02_9TELE